MHIGVNDSIEITPRINDTNKQQNISLNISQYYIHTMV